MLGWVDCPDCSHGCDGGDIADSYHLLNFRQKGLMKARCDMGLFSSFFVKRGLSDSSSNMKNPIGFQNCLRLCERYDNSGGYKTPSRLIIGEPTGPGMELYEIFRRDEKSLPEEGYYASYSHYRGVVFAKVYDGVELRVCDYSESIDWQGRVTPDGFSCLGKMEHVVDDLYRSISPFTAYVDGCEVTVQAEVNWNRTTNEFVYRERYTAIKKET